MFTRRDDRRTHPYLGYFSLASDCEGSCAAFGGSAGTNALSNIIEVIPWTSPFGKGLSRWGLNDISRLRFAMLRLLR